MDPFKDRLQARPPLIFGKPGFEIQRVNEQEEPWCATKGQLLTESRLCALLLQTRPSTTSSAIPVVNTPQCIGMLQQKRDVRRKSTLREEICIVSALGASQGNKEEGAPHQVLKALLKVLDGLALFLNAFLAQRKFGDYPPFADACVSKRNDVSKC